MALVLDAWGFHRTAASESPTDPPVDAMRGDLMLSGAVKPHQSSPSPIRGALWTSTPSDLCMPKGSGQWLDRNNRRTATTESTATVARGKGREPRPRGTLAAEAGSTACLECPLPLLAAAQPQLSRRSDAAASIENWEMARSPSEYRSRRNEAGRIVHGGWGPRAYSDCPSERGARPKPRVPRPSDPP
jgi:hypothetical protein